MPPGPLYNWFCVLHGATEVLAQAASLRASQAARTSAKLQQVVSLGEKSRTTVERRRKQNESDATSTKRTASRTTAQLKKVIYLAKDDPEPGANGSVQRPAEAFIQAEHSPLKSENATARNFTVEKLANSSPQCPGMPPAAKAEPVLDRSSAVAEAGRLGEVEAVSSKPLSSGTSKISLGEKTQTGITDGKSDGQVDVVQRTQNSISEPEPVLRELVTPESTDEAQVLTAELADPLLPSDQPSSRQRNLQASRVPSSKIGRLFHYGGLAASLGYGMASEALRRASSSQDEGEQSSLVMTSSNVSRLVEKLSKMRGAALKLGQFMSIQDSHILPKDVEEVFRRVQDSAHYMPNWQMERVMADSFGPDWASHFVSFERVPFAAASLGQVHAAVLAASSSPTGRDAKVAVKIQFPDIARSIESDLGYLKILLGAGRVLPKGLFLDKTLQVMKGELADECDYRREADCARFFASKDGLAGDVRFRVPWVWQGSTERVLVMEHMNGVSVGGNVVDTLSQASRDQIANNILELCMKELFAFRTMQTDPNWSNFLWNEQTQQIELIDFGATRTYTKSFMDKWMHLLQASVAEDRDACVHWSLALGYLTGAESEAMLDAHVRSLTLIATPFRVPGSTDGRYAFGRGTEWASITKEIRSLIPVMLSERLTPPPRETYSLNRKLSGAFLLASRLSARVDCQSIWKDTVAKYQFDQEPQTQ